MLSLISKYNIETSISCIDTYLLSHDGIGSLQLPEGKHTISEVPMRLLPLAQANLTRELSFVFCEPIIRLCFAGMEGQCTAILIKYALYT